MAEQTSVVTPERYGQGFTYPDYIAQINVNKDMFEKYTETAADAMTATTSRSSPRPPPWRAAPPG